MTYPGAQCHPTLCLVRNVAVTVFFLERDQALEHLFPLGVENAPHETDGLEALDANSRELLFPFPESLIVDPGAQPTFVRNVAMTVFFLERDQALE